MRRTLFHIPDTLFGLPVFGFGIAFVLLVAAVLLAAAWRFAKTKRFDEDIWSYLGLLVVGSVILLFVAPSVKEPEGFPIRGYGLFLLLGILAAFGLTLWQAARKNISADLIVSLCIWAVVSGILGARIFYVVEYWNEMAVRDVAGNIDPLGTFFSVLNIAKGGLVVFGSIIGGALGSLFFLWRSKMPILATFDMMAPAVMIGIAFGRIGCLMNGCCYGGICDASHGIVFPERSPAHEHQIIHGDTFYYGMKFKEIEENGKPRTIVTEIQPNSEAEKAGLKPEMMFHGIAGLINGKPTGWLIEKPVDVFRTIETFHESSPEENIRIDVYTDPARTETKPYFVAYTPSPVQPVYPTQIYSSFSAALLCAGLLVLGRLQLFRRHDGLVFAAFLMLYPMIRFLLELYRTDEDYAFGTGLTIAQIVGIFVFFFGCFLVVFILNFQQPTKKPEASVSGANHIEP